MKKKKKKVEEEEEETVVAVPAWIQRGLGEWSIIGGDKWVPLSASVILYTLAHCKVLVEPVRWCLVDFAVVLL